MKFQADAHISHELIATLREMGHDCLDSSSIPTRMPDVNVLEMAARDGWVVITADKDFGELVFVHQLDTPGVVLIRLAYPDETERVAHIRRVWPVVITRLPGSFITITPSQIRVRPIRAS